MKREFLQSLMIGDQPLPKELVDAIMEQHGKEVQAGKVWKEKYEQAEAAFQQQLQQVKFTHLLETAIRTAGGRNAKAITALLDMQALQQSQDPQADTAAALAQLKQQHDYLFEAAKAPPYAAATGTAVPAAKAPVSLAGALKERFEKRN